MRARPCETVLIILCSVGVATAPLPARANGPAEAPAVEPPAEAPAPAVAVEPPAEAPAVEPPEGPSPEAAPVVTPRPRRGIGLLSAGVPVSVLGIVGLGIGGAFLYEELDSVCAAEPCGSAGRGLSFFGAMIFFSGLLVFASGAAMTTVGAVRHHRYRQWRAKQVTRRWTPALARSAQGTWVAGLGLRF